MEEQVKGKQKGKGKRIHHITNVHVQKIPQTTEHMTLPETQPIYHQRQAFSILCFAIGI